MGVEVYFGPQKSWNDYRKKEYQMRVACRKLGIVYITDRAKQREYKEAQAVEKVFKTTPMRDCERIWQRAVSDCNSIEFQTATPN